MRKSNIVFKVLSWILFEIHHYLFCTIDYHYIREWMYVIIGSHFVPLESKFLLFLSYCHLWAFVRPLTFHILINSSEANGSIWTKLWWDGPWMAPFQNCVRWSRLPTKMAAKLKIEKRGDEILIVDCCFSISQNELKF